MTTTPTAADSSNPTVADDWLIVTEALEAAGWAGADDNPLEILQKDGATWAIANDCGDSGLSKDGWTVEFPSDTPVLVVIATCLAAVGQAPARRILGTTEQQAAGAQQPTPAVELTETADDVTRRFARRLAAVERLCSGRPGYHTVTVKRLLTAMSDADDEPTPTVVECEHVWTTALDGDDHPARDEAGRTWTHCGICGQEDDDFAALAGWAAQVSARNTNSPSPN